MKLPDFMYEYPDDPSMRCWPWGSVASFCIWFVFGVVLVAAVFIGLYWLLYGTLS